MEIEKTLLLWKNQNSKTKAYHSRNIQKYMETLCHLVEFTKIYLRSFSGILKDFASVLKKPHLSCFVIGSEPWGNWGCEKLSSDVE